jgi:amino acid adenylation domain-containing protein
MQSVETRGQIKVAAAQRPREAAYWRARLAGDWEKSNFPADAPSSAGRATATFELSLDQTIAEQLIRISQGREATLQVIVTAAVMALLARYTGSRQVVVGQPAVRQPGQPQPLSAALPLRATIEPQSTFRSLLEQTRSLTLGAIEHQDYPLELLAEEFGLAEGDGINPFFDVAIEAAQPGRPSLADETPLSVLFRIRLAGAQVGLTIGYDAARFDQRTIERIGRHFTALLGPALANPNLALAEIDLLTPRDIDVLTTANATDAPYDDAACIHELFARQAAATPDAVAVIHDGGALSYAELDARANRLAHTLRSRGVGPDQLVAVIAERSPEMMIAILAILKAGGAYLPIDPSYPADRIAYMLADSGARLALSYGDLAANVPAQHAVIDLRSAASYADDRSAPAAQSASRNLAYAIYTSGSTGQPKGVLIEHHSVINRLTWMQKAYPISAADVIVQKTPISFDVSVWELFWWMFQGASVCLLTPGGERDPEAIVRAIETQRITTMHFVPSMLNAFLDYVEAAEAQSRLTSLRQVFASGEALGVHQVRRFEQLLAAPNGSRLINLYGPTEATVDVSHYLCSGRGDLTRVPIGQPIDNIRLYVLDAQLRQQPVGAPGELYIAGVGLARGYHNRPELTAERFIEQPFAGEQRIYRTGDLARWLPDGTIEYLGRIDQQVKVRGFRIELGEIEERLRQHPAVREAAVIAREDGAGGKQLAAYVVGEQKTENREQGTSEQGRTEATDHRPLTTDHLRSFLADRLPEYMIPSAFVTLDALPLSPNGKLDRRALPDPDLSRARTAAYVAPRSEQERILAEIWADVLGQEQIGVNDNFFALGGDSIHFVTVLAKARGRGLHLTFQEFFAHPTVAELALALDGADSKRSSAQQYAPFELLSPADRARIPDGIEDAYPLSLLQAGLIFQNELTFGTAQYHDIFSYIIQSPFNAEVFEQAVRILVARNPIFRTSYHLTGFDVYIQQVHRTVEPALFIADLRDLDDAGQERWYQQWLDDEKAHRFVWDQPGLVRLHVHVLRDDLYRYTLSQHNSALDGWSITLIHTQLFDTYYRLLNGEAYDAPPIDNHLRNYIGLELQSLASGEDQQFWSALLEDGSFTALPRLKPEQPTTTLSVPFHDVHFSRDLSDRIIALADRLAVPVKNVLMAGHIKVLSMLAGERDVIVGYEHSGRPEVEDATRAIGLFLNTVPLRVRIADGSWERLIQQVYRAEADLLPHRRYPMAKMKQDLRTQEMLFETAFNYTHFYLLKELKKLPEFSLLDVQMNTETEFVLRAEFGRHFFTDQVRLSLHYHDHVFSAEQIALIGGYYQRAYELMTSDPAAEHQLQSLLSADEQRAIAALSAERQPQAAPLPDGELYVLDDQRLLAPVGTRGAIYVRAAEDDADAAPAPFQPGLALRRTELIGRWRPDGRLEYLGRADEQQRAVFKAAEKEAALSATPAAASEGRTAPTSEIERRIAEIWAEVLNIPLVDIALEDNFFDLDGTSLSAIRVALLSDGLISIPDLMRNSTLGPLARVVEQGAATARQPLMRRLSIDLGEDEVALVCFPYAGGNAINFRPLAQQMSERDPSLAVYAVELPGHDANGQGGGLPLRAAARRIADEIAAGTRTPIMLWGHCVGSALALETARLLEERQQDLRHVFIGGKLLYDPEMIHEQIAEAANSSDEQVMDVLISETGYAELDGLKPEQASALVRVFRHESSTANTYLAEARQEWQGHQLAAPITVVVASDDPLTAEYAQRYQAWSLFADTITLREIDGGGHYFCRTRPEDVAAIALAARGVVDVQ